nr:carboxylesterase family protein [Phenylobacterium sp. J367]
MSVARALAVVLALGLAAASPPATAQPAVAGAAPVAAGPVVKLSQGSVRGTVADGAAVFQGIPFAAPPVDDLRWKPPAEAAKWTGVRDGTKPGANCTQSEDCLFVNVTRPAGAKAGAKLPVMVWIHGGAFVAGNSTAAFGAVHDGTEFAKQGVVLVTLNYRLGRAGWFAHPALTREGGPTGNYGLMDQVAALKWVKANIASFGGDPGNVTIFGESAGGISVFYLMLAPAGPRALPQGGVGERLRAPCPRQPAGRRGAGPQGRPGRRRAGRGRHGRRRAPQAADLGHALYRALHRPRPADPRRDVDQLGHRRGLRGRPPGQGPAADRRQLQ